AKQVFEQLVDREPESEPAKRKLNDVVRRLGGTVPEEPIPVMEDSAPVELVKPPAPKVRPGLDSTPPPEVSAKPAAQAKAPVEPPSPVAPAVVEAPLDEETQKFITQSLTDVDLFASYGLTQKAIGLLEAILRRAPRHTPTLEKLLDFVLGAGDDRRTAELAAQLEQVHRERGDSRTADRFGELRRRYQRAAGLSDADLATVTAPQATAATEAEEAPIAEIEAMPVAPTQPPGPPPAAAKMPEPAEVTASQPAAPAHEEQVQEVDLS